MAAKRIDCQTIEVNSMYSEKTTINVNVFRHPWVSDSVKPGPVKTPVNISKNPWAGKKILPLWKNNCSDPVKIQKKDNFPMDGKQIFFP